MLRQICAREPLMGYESRKHRLSGDWQREIMNGSGGWAGGGRAVSNARGDEVDGLSGMKVRGMPAGLRFMRALRPPVLCARLLRRYALVPALALAALVLAAAPASATKARLLEASFGPDGTAATAFERPVAVGVDQSTGQIYVEDGQANTVQRFNSAHEPEPFTGIAPNIKAGKLTGFSLVQGQALNQIAVNSTSHDLYVSDIGHNSVKAYQSDGEPANFTAGPGVGTNEIGGSEPCGVAVDPSGAIYVSFANGIHVYAATGELLTTFSLGVPCNLAVDSHGTVYAAQFRGGVEELTPSEFPVTPATTYTSAGVVDANVAWGVAVDPATNDLFVDEHTRLVEYNEGASEELLAFAASGPGALTASEGLAVNSVSGRVYVSDTAGERQVAVFGPTVVLPEVKTGEASEIHPSSATLNGTVNPEGVEVTDCHFDYGTSTSYGQTAACEQTVGSGSGEVAVTAKLNVLTPGTTYHFRLEATNASATNLGADATFSTPPPPTVTALPATSVTKSSATLNAQVNPNGLEVTSCRFEYGTEAGVYPNNLTCTPPPGSGSSNVSVTGQIEKLHANKTYHWRVVAVSAAGVSSSPDQTFIYPIASAAEASCAALPEPERQHEEQVRQERGSGALPDCRAYELVTPAQKNGALISETFLSAAASEPVIAKDGQRVIAPSLSCLAEPQSCVGFRKSEGEPYELTRTSNGWVTSSLAPPTTSFETNTYLSLNADAGTALLSIPAPQSEVDNFYARNDSSFLAIGPFGDIEGSSNVEKLEQEGFVATADLSHVVYGTHRRAWSFDHGEFRSLYEYVGTGNTRTAAHRRVKQRPAQELRSRTDQHLRNPPRWPQWHARAVWVALRRRPHGVFHRTGKGGERGLPACRRALRPHRR